jgi:AcrR family transcriptional regulator
MATERFRKLSIERRDAILNAALDEFAVEGFDAGKLQGVARRARVTKSLLYYYFEDRQDLLSTLFATVMTALKPLIGTVPVAPTPAEYWGWVEALYRRMTAALGERPALLRFIVRVLSEVASGRMPPGFERYHRLTQQNVGAVIQLGQSCGAVRMDLPPGLLQAAVMSLMTASDRWLAGEIGNERAIPAILELYRSAFGTVKVARRG